MRYQGTRAGLMAALRECARRGYDLTRDALRIQLVLDRYGKTTGLPGKRQVSERSMMLLQHQQTYNIVASKDIGSNEPQRKYLLVRESDSANCYVQTANGIRQLPHIVRHSPTGFEWGYGGSGPADLARSILTDAVGSEIADQVYQAFKAAVIAMMPYDGGTILTDEIREFLQGVQVA